MINDFCLRLRSMLRPNKVEPSISATVPGQLTTHDMPSFTLRLVSKQGGCVILRARTSEELYLQFKIFAIEKIKGTYTMTPSDIFDAYGITLYFGTKPLSKIHNIALLHYGVHDNDVIRVEIHGMVGGSSEPLTLQVGDIQLPTYTHVKACEKSLLNRLQIQSRDSDESPLSDDQSILNWRIIANAIEKHSTFFPQVDIDWLNTQLENISIVIRFAQKCTTMGDYIGLTQMSYRLFTGRCLTTVITKRIDTLFSSQVQSLDVGETLAIFRRAFNMSTQVTDCELTKKLVGLYSFLLTQGFLQHFGLTLNDEDYSKMEQRALLSAYSSKKAFFVSVLDTTLFVCERINEWRLTGDVTALVHSGSEYSKWLKEADRILNLAPFTGNLKAHGTSYFSYLSDLKDAIEHGSAYAKYTKSVAGVDSVVISRKLNSLQLLQNTEITRRAAQQERSQPMGVLVYGSSSVAKSAFTKMMYNYYGALFDYDRDDQYRYVRNPMDEYWSNFDSSKWCIQLDDIAFLNPVKTTGVDSTLQDLLNVVNNVPYVPPQAALEDKGKTPVMAKLVIATSNCKTLNAREYFWCPLAVRRRLPYVVNVKPKQEFMHDNQVFIDPMKIVVEDGKFPDLWEIEVFKIVPRLYADREYAELESVAMFTEVEKFLQHFGKACMDHEKNQTKAMAKDDDMMKIDVCKNCFLPLPHDTCLHVQYADWEPSKVLYNLCIYVLMWLIQFQWCFTFMKTLAYYRLTRGGACRIMNMITDSDLSVRFFGSLTVAISDKKTQRLMMCCVAIASALAVYTVVNPTKPKKVKSDEDEIVYTVQGNKFGTTQEQLLKEESQNVWYKASMELTTFDVPKASTSLVGITPEGVRDLFAKNCVRLRIRVVGEKSTRHMRAVFLKSHLCVTNAHAFKEEGDEFTVDIYQGAQLQGVTSNLSIRLKRKDIAFSPSSDLCMFEVSSIPPFKDITNFWVEREITPTSALCLSRDMDGSIKKWNLYGLRLERMAVEELGGVFDIHLGQTDIITEDGMCGSLCVSITPRGPIIIGLHLLGAQHHLGVLSVKKGELENLEKMSCITKRPRVQGGTQPNLSCASRQNVVTEVHRKSLFRYIEDGVANVYGSFAGFRPKPKSSVTATPLQAEILEHYGVEVGYGKPLMTGWLPWRKNVVEMVKPNVMYERDILQDCVKAYAADIIAGLPEGWEKELVVLSDAASVNGLAGVKYIDKIATNTSMGFPWCTTKKAFLHAEHTEDHPDGVNFDDEVWKRVRHIESLYAQGKRAFPVFTGHLKDEATAHAKCEIGKTRLFTGAPIDWSLVVRKNLLSYVRLIQKNKYVFEAGPGTVCQSSEWGEMRNYLTHFGEDRMVAGDYGKFDKRMLADFILAAFEVIIAVHKAAGFEDEFLLSLMCIGEDIAFPLSNINGDLVEFYGTNPSGHPLTVIVNSMVNALYMRYCYRKLNPDGEVHTFKNNVHLMTYGDDNTCGVSKRTPWFNHTAIRDQLAHIGVEYTMADKTSESVPFIHINDVSFLKRRWVWDSEVKDWLCPLEEESIIKSLTVWVPSKSIDPYAQMVAVITSANDEYFFYGREVFEKQHRFFKSLLEKDVYRCYVNENTLLGFDELTERFRRASGPRG